MKHTIQSPLLAVALTSAIGIACLLAEAAGLLGKSDIVRAGQARWWAWSSIFRQLTMAMVIDNFGWLDARKQPINAGKIGGALLLCLGALLMGKK